MTDEAMVERVADAIIGALENWDADIDAGLGWILSGPRQVAFKTSLARAAIEAMRVADFPKNK